MNQSASFFNNLKTCIYSESCAQAIIVVIATVKNNNNNNSQKMKPNLGQYRVGDRLNW